MRRGRNSDTDSSLRELARSVELYRIRPHAPRQVQYNGNGVLSWEAPKNRSGITHFRVYGPDENTLIREVPGDQTQVNDLFTVARVFISSFNKPTELESRKVLLATQVGMADGLADDFVEKNPPVGSAGVEYTSLVTNVVKNEEYVVMDVGGQGFRIYGTFTEPAVSTFLGTAIVGELNGQRGGVLAFYPKGSSAYTTPFLPVREDANGAPVTDAWTFWFVSVSHDNRRNSILDGTTPKLTASVVRQVGLGGTNLKKARFFSTSEFQIDPTNGLTMNQLNVDKLLVGSIARFGFNGPGQWAAYDTFNTIVAWGGVNNSFYGLWGKNVWIGGSDPSTAPFSVDSSGNVVIDNTGLSARATFTLVRNGATTKLVNEVPGSGGLIVGLDVSQSTERTQISAGFADYHSSGIRRASSNVLGYFVYNSGGTLLATLSSTDGVLDCKGIKISGTERIDSSGQMKPTAVLIGGSLVLTSGRAGQFSSVNIDDGFTVVGSINTANQFIGAGVNCNAGVAGTGFNIYGGSYFGKTGVGIQRVTDVRSNFGVIQIKTRQMDTRGGIITEIGAESGWTDIVYVT